MRRRTEQVGKRREKLCGVRLCGTPLGKGSLSIWLNVFAFYVVATPICAVIALTELLSTS